MSLPFPPRQAVLTTLRGLLRSSNPKISGRRARPQTLASEWTAEVLSLYRKHQGCTDAKLAWKMHNMAEDALSMHKSSTEHAECMFDAGWCLGRSNMDQVTKVSRFVGLDMPQLYREGADADADAAAEAANGSEDPFFEALGHDAGALGGVTEVKAAQPESRPQG